MRSLVLNRKDQPFAVVGFSVNEYESKTLAEIMQKADLPWRSFKYGDSVAERWNPATPTFYTLDAKGVIRNKWIGGVGAPAMDKALDKLIAETRRPRKK